ncbi:MAG: ATP-binding protein [Planctomycetota bacterium]
MGRKSGKARSAAKALIQAKRICARASVPSAKGRTGARATGAPKSDSEILEAARVLFKLRSGIESEKDEGAADEAMAVERRLKAVLHSMIARSPDDLHIAAVFRRHRLNRIEREAVLLLALSATGMVERTSDIEDLQERMGLSGRDGLALVKAFRTEGRLAANGLVVLEPGSQPVLTEVTASPAFLDPLLGLGSAGSAWRVKTYDGLLDKCHALFKALKARAEALDDSSWQDETPECARQTAALKRLMSTLRATVRLHPGWPMHRLVQSDLANSELQMVLVLVGKELGFLQADDDLFTGEGLARAASTSVPGVRHTLKLLSMKERLRAEAYVQVCGGACDSGATEDEATIRTCEFELTPGLCEKLKIKKRRRSKNKARKPVAQMSQLVLPAEVLRSLDMIIAQVRHAKVLLEDWGLADAVPYGRGVTVLFSGAPGLGKTACAEAVAHELGKDIIAVSYAEIQNCWVGQTAKNIVRVFRQAADEDAILFWDEADAMFYDRDSASRNWEVRDVNVLLQEMERFGGLCILATNRKITLDRALERRVAVKVEFTPPTRSMRREIWRRLLPEKLPLADDVELDGLAKRELTGGEIKNVVLNAARIALARDPRGEVRARDFDRAMRMETDSRWTVGRRMGFAAE